MFLIWLSNERVDCERCLFDIRYRCMWRSYDFYIGLSKSFCLASGLGFDVIALPGGVWAER